MSFLKNMHNAMNMSDEEAKKQFVAFELSIEYKKDINMKLDEHEITFLYKRDALLKKLFLTRDSYHQLRSKLKNSWQFVLKRD